MSAADSTTLAEQFAALSAERERTWPAEQLAKNVGQRRELVERFDPVAIAQVGERIESFTLPDVDDGALTLDRLVANGPAVLIFFRYAGCPACNIAIPYYDRTLFPALADAGIPLVAVSPQLPEGLKAIRDRHGLRLTVASDPGNRLARRLGISFVPSKLPEGPPAAGWIGELTGTGTWELPQPTILILEGDLTVRSIDVSPDWLARPEAEQVLARLPEVRVKAAA